jgi:transposase
MRKTREILRLKYEQGLSHRAIVRSCQVGLGTVNEYVSRAERAQLVWPLPADWTDADLDEALFPKPVSSEPFARALPDWEALAKELRREKVTRFLLWEEYHRDHPDGYSYSHFCDLFRQFTETSASWMHQVHKAGEKLFVDYAGQTLSVINTITGEVAQVQIFVATWGASDYTYTEATWTQSQADWIASHVRAFHFFGGCPQLLVPDNLKAGVTTPCRYQPLLNRCYEEMARHYGITILPARIGKPRDKAVVENHVLNVERRILAALRDRKFVGLSDCNKAIAELLAELNDRPFQKMRGSRRSLFQEIDVPAFLPLPEHRYEYAQWTKARLGFHYHLCVEGCHYSGPYSLTKKMLDVRLTQSVVEIFHDTQRVASHVRSYIRGSYTTSRDHMPSSHRAHAEWTAERLVSWAGSTGPHTRTTIEMILGRREHPEQSFKMCMGVMSLGRRYGIERLEAACNRGLTIGAPTYKSLKSILDAKLDSIALPVAEPARTTPDHPNIRGAAYFQATLGLDGNER